jgi:uncharacterized membrane protein YhaH (DUF805 family)
MTPYRASTDPRDVPTRSRLARLAALWFGLRVPVGRRAYVITGVSLMALKYALDVAVVWAATGNTLGPLSYAVPSGILRQAAFGRDAPPGLLALLGIMTLPFLWIGISMSVRRAADAGLTPWAGMLFLFPALNYVAMIVFAILPSKEGHGWERAHDAPPTSVPMDPGVKAAIYAVLASVAEGIAMTAFAVYGLRSYGGVLFLVTPCVMGATSALLYNRPQRRSLGRTILVALIGTVATGGALLLFAVEGILCLAMAFPIAAALACIGAIVGRSICENRATPRYAAFAFFLVPGAAGAEAIVSQPTLREVVTMTEIDAPPEAVWPNVIGFSELPAPPEWFFRLGIAYPQRARIEGGGVGAVRHCEFSTGPFVEPITRWEPPSRLSFDVRSQPPSMTEWSFYRSVNAPHLEGYMVSRRGEFRLVRLPHDRTRLEGSTWYTLAIYPEPYWVVFSDALLHAIHGRVLAHVKALSETNYRAGRETPAPAE